jgi:hypothetical protein
MNCRALSVLVAILTVVALPKARADEKPAGDPQKAAVLKKSDARILLEAGRATGSLPKGVVVHLSANMTRLPSQTRKHGAGVEKTFKERWEFTPNRIDRIVEIPGRNGGNATRERAESLPLDTSNICKELLDGRILTIGEDDTGKRENFIGTDYDIGHRSIEITLNGKSMLYVGESCVVAGYAENDARAFAALYEKLASHARDAFEAKSLRERQAK